MLSWLTRGLAPAPGVSIPLGTDPGTRSPLQVLSLPGAGSTASVLAVGAGPLLPHILALRLGAPGSSWPALPLPSEPCLCWQGSWRDGARARQAWHRAPAPTLALSREWHLSEAGGCSSRASPVGSGKCEPSTTPLWLPRWQSLAGGHSARTKGDAAHGSPEGTINAHPTPPAPTRCAPALRGGAGSTVRGLALAEPSAFPASSEVVSSQFLALLSESEGLRALPVPRARAGCRLPLGRREPQGPSGDHMGAGKHPLTAPWKLFPSHPQQDQDGDRMWVGGPTPQGAQGRGEAGCRGLEQSAERGQAQFAVFQ